MKVYPKNLTECVFFLDNEINKFQDNNINIRLKNEIRNCEKKDMIKYHHGLGTHIRNELYLWHNPPDLKLSFEKSTKIEFLTNMFFQTLGVNNADDMSHIILEAYWDYVHDCFDEQKIINEITIKQIIE